MLVENQDGLVWTQAPVQVPKLMEWQTHFASCWTTHGEQKMKIQLHLVTLIMYDTIWYVVRLCMLRCNRIFIFTTGVPARTWSKQNLCAWEIRNGRWHVFLPVKSNTLLQANCVMFQMFPVMARETRIMTQEETRRRSKRWWEEIRRDEKKKKRKKGMSKYGRMSRRQTGP